MTSLRMNKAKDGGTQVQDYRRVLLRLARQECLCARMDRLSRATGAVCLPCEANAVLRGASA